MLTKAKHEKMNNALKAYCRKYLYGNIKDLDESGTRLLINSFLSDILNFEPIEEIKTEYMIRGTYADYMIQIKGVRHFLVEVKAFSLSLSDKHLRQTINYGANEGVEWALLTNGKCFNFYKILFAKPIESKLIFSVDLTDTGSFKNSLESLQYLHKDSILKNGLAHLWNKTVALSPNNLAGILYAPTILNFIKRTINEKHKVKFSDNQIEHSLNRLISDKIDLNTVKPLRAKKEKARQVIAIAQAMATEPPAQEVTGVNIP